MGKEQEKIIKKQAKEINRIRGILVKAGDLINRPFDDYFYNNGDAEMLAHDMIDVVMTMICTALEKPTFDMSLQMAAGNSRVLRLWNLRNRRPTISSDDTKSIIAEMKSIKGEMDGEASLWKTFKAEFHEMVAKLEPPPTPEVNDDPPITPR